MVMAATRKISRMGIHSNKGRTSAMLREKNDSTQKNTNRLTARKVARNTKATGEEKNRVSSLRAIRNRLRSGCMGHLPGCLVDFPEQGFQIPDFRSQCIKLAAGLDHPLGQVGAGLVKFAVGPDFDPVARAFGVCLQGLDALHGGCTLQRLAESVRCQAGGEQHPVALLQLCQGGVQGQLPWRIISTRSQTALTSCMI